MRAWLSSVGWINLDAVHGSRQFVELELRWYVEAFSRAGMLEIARHVEPRAGCVEHSLGGIAQGTLFSGR